jgi:hypothetical protein
VHAYRLNLLAVLAVLIVPASAQSIGDIPVTQAGLVPAPAYNSLTADHKVPAVMPNGGVPASTTMPGTPQGNAWQVGQTLVPSVPPEQLMAGYVVREGTMPVFRTAREIYSPKGLEDLSFHEHPGLHVGNFRNLNAKQAEAMFDEDERLQEISDFKDTAHAIDVGGDPAEARAISKATDDAFIRSDYSLTPTNDIMDAPPPRVGTMLTNFEQMRLTWLEDRF